MNRSQASGCTPPDDGQPDVALRLAQADIVRLGLQASVTRHGPQGLPRCRLFAGDHVVAEGWGKGDPAAALVGAHVEALERWYTTSPLTPRRASARILTAAEIAAQPALHGDQVIQRWAREFPSDTAACSRYVGATEELSHPLFLLDPWYHRDPLPGDTVARYRSMLRYTASTGTAAWTSRAGAELQALYELIEHDAISHALLRWQLLAEAVEVVDQATVPAEVAARLDLARSVVGGPIVLLDVTSDLGVPTFVAAEDGAGVTWPRHGSASSVDSSSAACQALDELVQVAHGRAARLAAAAADRLARWPLLQRCTGLHKAVPATAVRSVPFREPSVSPDTLEQQLRHLDELLSEKAIQRYAADLTDEAASIRVVVCVAPLLERFSLIRLGHPVLPTGRGWRLWQEHFESQT